MVTIDATPHIPTYLPIYLFTKKKKKTKKKEKKTAV
jgi:hypothetical protein